MAGSVSNLVSLTSAHSQQISVLSQQVSALSQSLSSQAAALSVRIDTQSQSISVLSVQVASAISIANAASNAASIVSQALSVQAAILSNLASAHSALSQAVSVMSTTLSNLASIVSAISQQASVTSQKVSTLISTLSIMSVGGLTRVQMKVVAGAQAAASAVVKISGLSVSLALSTYKLEGMLLFSVSGTGSVALGFSTSTAAFGAFVGTWDTAVSTVSGGTAGRVIGNFVTQNTSQISFIPGTSGRVMLAYVYAVVRVTTAGSIQMKMTPTTSSPTTVLQGSWLQAFLIG